MGALLMCSERIVRVVNIGRIYEQTYKGDSMPGEAMVQLQDDLVSLYQAALEILANAEHLFSMGTCRRTMHAILFPHQTSGLFSTLADREAIVGRVASACGAVADAHLLHMIHGPVARIDQGVEALLQRQDRDMAIKILDWISEIDFDAQHTTAKKGRAADTCQWLLDNSEFCSWNDVSASSILCLEGPRKRKSVARYIN